MSKKPVVVYGANGFSGRWIAEFLREYNTPFIAAGRNAARVKDVMEHVPGIETADFEIAEAAGSLDDLLQLFEGTKVVCNTAGPFIHNGARVIEAALKSGCHYIDIGGEQAWTREVAENWGEKFAARGLPAAPATAFMCAVSDAAARLCVETGAIDTLETLTMFKGVPTFGSTQTIFAVIQTEAYYLEQNRYKPWPHASCVVVPGYLQTQLALAWGGFPQPVWFKHHPQVANVRSMGGLLDRQIMEGLPQAKSCSKKRLGRFQMRTRKRNSPRWPRRSRRERRPARISATSERLTLWSAGARPITHNALSSAPVVIARLVSSRRLRHTILFTVRRAKPAWLPRRKLSGTARYCGCSSSTVCTRFDWFPSRHGGD